MGEVDTLKPPPRDGTCKNCGAELVGPHCSACGQRDGPMDLSLGGWSRDGLETLVSFDWRFARTVRALSVAPGRTTWRWIAGERVRFTGPVRYVLLTCALWWGAHAVLTDETLVAQLSPADAAVYRYGQLLNLAMVPLLASVSYLAFLGSGTRLVEHASLVLYVLGHVFLERFFLVVFGNLFRLPATIVNEVDPLFLIAYTLWALLDFYRGRSTLFLRLLRSVASLVLLLLASTMLLEVAVRGLRRTMQDAGEAPQTSTPGEELGEPAPAVDGS